MFKDKTVVPPIELSKPENIEPILTRLQQRLAQHGGPDTVRLREAVREALFAIRRAKQTGEPGFRTRPKGVER